MNEHERRTAIYDDLGLDDDEQVRLMNDGVARAALEKTLAYQAAALRVALRDLGYKIMAALGLSKRDV